MNVINYKDTFVNDKGDLISKYGKGEFDSPFRSTIPLIELVFEEKLLKESFDYDSNAKFVFEHATSVKKGKGFPSCTDLVISDDGKSCFIEAKRTEPQYETVKEWLGTSTNRADVLNGWLEYINERCKKNIKIQDVNDIVYQMVHRFASACNGETKTELVYILFKPDEKDGYVENLQKLKNLVGDIVPIRLIVFDIKENKLKDLQQRWEKEKERNLSEEIRQILIEESPVMSFEKVEEIRF